MRSLLHSLRRIVARLIETWRHEHPVRAYERNQRYSLWEDPTQLPPADEEEEEETRNKPLALAGGHRSASEGYF